MDLSLSIDRVGHVTSTEVKPFEVKYRVSYVFGGGGVGDTQKGDSGVSIDYGVWSVSLTTGFTIRVVRPSDVPRVSVGEGQTDGLVERVTSTLERRFLDDLMLETQWVVGRIGNKTEQKRDESYSGSGFYPTTYLITKHTDEYDRHMTTHKGES